MEEYCASLSIMTAIIQSTLTRLMNAFVLVRYLPVQVHKLSVQLDHLARTTPPLHPSPVLYVSDPACVLDPPPP